VSALTISTHVLDTAAGRPAAGVRVRLLRVDGSLATIVADAVTDADGRVAALVPHGFDGGAGVYRITFDVGGYFAARVQDSFYTTVAIEVRVADAAAHHHVPLLVSPFGYTTYRGS
jgi:5-hydroxyisourate hydrolase